MKETVLTSAILILAILAVRQLFQSRISRRLVYGISHGSAAHGNVYE